MHKRCMQIYGLITISEHRRHSRTNLTSPLLTTYTLTATDSLQFLHFCNSIIKLTANILNVSSNAGQLLNNESRETMTTSAEVILSRCKTKVLIMNESYAAFKWLPVTAGTSVVLMPTTDSAANVFVQLTLLQRRKALIWWLQAMVPTQNALK